MPIFNSSEEGLQMPASVTPEYLLEDAAYALEQCGLLLRDANLLYQSGSYASKQSCPPMARIVAAKVHRTKLVASRHIANQMASTPAAAHRPVGPAPRYRTAGPFFFVATF
jgi:hypothetical protein